MGHGLVSFSPHHLEGAMRWRDRGETGGETEGEDGEKDISPFPSPSLYLCLMQQSRYVM
jgi:hypothetical protein